MSTNSRLTRLFDIIIAFLGLVITSPLALVILVVGFIKFGSPIFRQKRMGVNCIPFEMLKFRSMHPDTPNVATHLLPMSRLTNFGRGLRASKLDEIPQLWNVLWGSMSIVGPRPCLINQSAIIELRKRAGLFALRPGITGYAQVLGIDMSDPKQLVDAEMRYIAGYNVFEYLKFIGLTASRRALKDRVQRTVN